MSTLLTLQAVSSKTSHEEYKAYLNNMVLAGCPSGLAVYQPVHETLQHGQLLQEELCSESSHSRLLPSMLLLLHSQWNWLPPYAYVLPCCSCGTDLFGSLTTVICARSIAASPTSLECSRDPL